MIRKLQNIIEKNKSAAAYLFWGCMTTLVSWASYSLFVTVLHCGDKTIPIANILSWLCSVLFAFGTNKVWVFGSRDWSLTVVLSEFWKFIAARILTGLLEIAGVPALVAVGLDQTIWGIEGMAAKVLVSVAVIILNYILSKVLVFRSKKKS